MKRKDYDEEDRKPNFNRLLTEEEIALIRNDQKPISFWKDLFKKDQEEREGERI